MGKRKRKPEVSVDAVIMVPSHIAIQTAASASTSLNDTENVNMSEISHRKKKKRKSKKKNVSHNASQVPDPANERRPIVPCSVNQIADDITYDTSSHHQEILELQEPSSYIPAVEIPVDAQDAKRKKKKAKKRKRKKNTLDGSAIMRENTSTSQSHTSQMVPDAATESSFELVGARTLGGDYNQHQNDGTLSLNSVAIPFATGKRKRRKRAKASLVPIESSALEHNSPFQQSATKGASRNQLDSTMDRTIPMKLENQHDSCSSFTPLQSTLDIVPVIEGPKWIDMATDSLRKHVDAMELEAPALVYIQRLESVNDSLKEKINYLEGKLQTLQEYGKKNMKMITCEICMEFFTNPHVLECGHTYCYACIKPWSEKNESNGSCPSCRNPLTLRPRLNLGMEQIVHHLVEQLDSPKRDSQLLRLSRAKEGFKAIGELWPNWKEVEREVIMDMDDGVERYFLFMEMHSLWMGDLER
jgi:hypothetical protein